MTETTAPPAARPVRLVVNGVPTTLELEPRVSLLDALREHLHLTGTKKGCNQGACGACTVLADGRRIVSCLALAVQYDGREITTIEGVGPHRAPLQDAFIRIDGFQCGYCTPGPDLLGDRHARRARRRRAQRGDRARAAPPRRARRDEIRERMSGNLCRCGAYNGIVDAIESDADSEAGPMKPFEYERATDVAHGARRCSPSAPTREFLGGGTNLVDLMREGIETPDSARRRHPAAAGRDRGDCPTAALRDRRRGHEQPTWPHHPLVRTALSAAVAGGPDRRVGAAPQHGHRRRQPAAAHPLPLLLRPRRRLQQARARHRLRRASTGSTGCARSWGPASTASRRIPRDMAVALAAARRPRRASTSSGRRPRGRRHRLPPAARRDAAPRDRPGGRRADHGRRAAGAARGRPLALPQGARPGLVRVRAGLGRGGPGRRGRPDHERRGWRSAVSRPSRGGQRPPSRSCSAPSRPTRRSPRRPRPSWPTRNRCPATSSRSTSPGAPWSPCCARLRDEAVRHDHTHRRPDHGTHRIPDRTAAPADAGPGSAGRSTGSTARRRPPARRRSRPSTRSRTSPTPSSCTPPSPAAGSAASTPRGPRRIRASSPVLTHLNAPKLTPPPTPGQPHGPQHAWSSAAASPYLNTDEVHYDGQPVAVVVAETPGGGPVRRVARRGRLRPVAGPRRLRRRAVPSARRSAESLGDADHERPQGRRARRRWPALAATAWTCGSPRRTHNHNAIEPHATTAVWDGDPSPSTTPPEHRLDPQAPRPAVRRAGWRRSACWRRSSAAVSAARASVWSGHAAHGAWPPGSTGRPVRHGAHPRRRLPHRRRPHADRAAGRARRHRGRAADGADPRGQRHAQLGRSAAAPTRSSRASGDLYDAPAILLRAVGRRARPAPQHRHAGARRVDGHASPWSRRSTSSPASSGIDPVDLRLRNEPAVNPDARHAASRTAGSARSWTLGARRVRLARQRDPDTR